MSSGDRKEIDEIITKYEFEPSLDKEIYVEGTVDKAIVELFLKKSKIKNITVLDIQTVNIAKDKIVRLKLNFDEDNDENNNRTRIIALCSLVKTGIIGIIDSDFDFLKSPCYEIPSHLLSTDYANMEMYCFNEETLEKLLLGYPSKQPENYRLFLNMLSSILQELFLIRYAKESIEKKLKYCDFNNKKYLFLESKTINFNKEIYLQNYLSHKQESIVKFNAYIDEIKTKLPTENKKMIQGHDFVSLLQFYLEIKQKDAKLTFEKSLYSSLEYDMLKEEEMFKKLLLLLKETSHA